MTEEAKVEQVTGDFFDADALDAGFEPIRVKLGGQIHSIDRVDGNMMKLMEDGTRAAEEGRVSDALNILADVLGVEVGVIQQTPVRVSFAVFKHVFDKIGEQLRGVGENPTTATDGSTPKS